MLKYIEIYYVIVYSIMSCEGWNKYLSIGFIQEVNHNDNNIILQIMLYNITTIMLYNITTIAMRHISGKYDHDI